MSRTVVVGVEGTESSDDALEGTAQLSARRGGETKRLQVSFRVGTKIAAVPEHESPYFTQ